MSQGPYLKVPYSNKRSPGGYLLDSTIEEVQAALPSDVDGLTVDDSLRIVCVNFPEGITGATMKKVEDHLKSQGFEVS
jgi:hypothetical protein